MSKKDFKIVEINKTLCESILSKYHYLTDISRGFKSGINFGLYKDNILLGVCIFTGFPVPELAKGCFGLNRDEQEGLYELSRLCLIPEIQKTEYNITSWFVSKCLKNMKKRKARAILSYADSLFHNGIIYRACNFKYYGLTDLKKDFWIKQNDGSFKKHSRGKTKGLSGEWRPRTQKHRYLIVYDKKLKCKWKEQTW